MIHLLHLRHPITILTQHRLQLRLPLTHVRMHLEIGSDFTPDLFRILSKSQCGSSLLSLPHRGRNTKDDSSTGVAAK